MTPALLALTLLLLILLSVYRSAVKCPNCGSISATVDPILPKWHRCSRCHTPYEVKLH